MSCLSRQRRAFSAVGASILAFCTSTAALAADPVGTWQTTDGKACIRTEHCGPEDAGLCAYLVWMEYPFDRDGAPIRDVENPDPGKRSRPVLGEEIMVGLKPGSGGRYAGKVYNFGDGKRYDVVLWSDDLPSLSIMGCAPGIFCGTQTWSRAADALPGQLVGLIGAGDGPRADE